MPILARIKDTLTLLAAVGVVHQYYRAGIAWWRSPGQDSSAVTMRDMSQNVASCPKPTYATLPAEFSSPTAGLTCYVSAEAVVKVLRKHLPAAEAERVGSAISEKMQQCPALKDAIENDQILVVRTCEGDGGGVLMSCFQSDGQESILAVEGNTVTFIPARPPQDAEGRLIHSAARAMYSHWNFVEQPPQLREQVFRHPPLMQAWGRAIQQEEGVAIRNHWRSNEKYHSPCTFSSGMADRRMWAGAHFAITNKDGQTTDYHIKNTGGIFYTMRETIVDRVIPAITNPVRRMVGM